MIVVGPEGFRKNQYRKFNIRAAQLTPGDDYGMMREVLTRRFKRLLAEAPRAPAPDAAPADAPPDDGAGAAESDSPWPDLVVIDGGPGQLGAARETLAAARRRRCRSSPSPRGPSATPATRPSTCPSALRSNCRHAMRCSISSSGCATRPTGLRSARIGQRRKRDIREAGLREIAGIGPTRRRALLHHFGTLKAIERASVADLAEVPGINAETARRIYEFFHEKVT